MYILAIDTSCDETAVAITEGQKIISNVLYSQVLMHTQWGGVVPSLAKRAHEERIGTVIEKTCRSFLAYKKISCDKKYIVEEAMKHIDYIAVTQGPGLAIALEVGINTAKELANKYNKKIIPVNHMSGHIYSCFAENRNGNPHRTFEFPYLALLISGGHTELVLFKDHNDYEIVGHTVDDAAGEALDKAARLLGFGYPGAHVLERLADEIGNKDEFKFPRPMMKSHDLNFSYSGLKTAFYYKVKEMGEESKNIHLKELASSIQEAIFVSIIKKTEQAIKQYNVNRLVIGGGVIANMYMRQLLRNLVKKYSGTVYFPPFKYLTGDNASMIGISAAFKTSSAVLPENMPDREPRMSL